MVGFVVLIVCSLKKDQAGFDILNDYVCALNDRGKIFQIALILPVSWVR